MTLGWERWGDARPLDQSDMDDRGYQRKEQGEALSAVAGAKVNSSGAEGAGDSEGIDEKGRED